MRQHSTYRAVRREFAKLQWKGFGRGTDASWPRWWHERGALYGTGTLFGFAAWNIGRVLKGGAAIWKDRRDAANAAFARAMLRGSEFRR